MDRGIPEFNRLVVQRQNFVNKAVHKIKLRTIQKAIDNEMPLSL